MKKIKETISRLTASDKFWAAAIFVITFAVFSPSLFFREFIGSDLLYCDQLLSLQNSFLRIFDLRTPLTGSSLCIDYLIWGEKNFLSGAHLTNILLHCGNALLFFMLLRTMNWGGKQLTPAWAGMAALIFALHPQRVEAVAWLSERKDCLAMFTGLAALFFFLRAMRKNKISWAGGALLWLSLLAGPVWLFFIVPAAALIWSERRSFQWQLYLKLLFPSFAAFCVFTGFFLCDSSSASAAPGMKTPFLLQLETVCFNYGNYFLRSFLPGNLFPLYPYYDPECAPRWMALIPGALCLVPFLAREKMLRSAVIYGVIPVLICFTAALLPVLIFSEYPGDFADRFSSLPSLFLITGAAFLLSSSLPPASSFGRWMPVLGILYCCGMAAETIRYLPVWKDLRSITERSLSPQKPNLRAVFNMALDLYTKGEHSKALELCKEKLPESFYYPRELNRIIRDFKFCLNKLHPAQAENKLAGTKKSAAEKYLKRASVFDPRDPLFRQNLNYAIQKLETQKK